MLWLLTFYFSLVCRVFISVMNKIHHVKCYRRLLLFFLLFFYVSPLKADTLYLTSLNWPPYASEQLENKGAVVEVTRAALRAMGHELVVDFYPWNRAVRLATRSHTKYLGYIPEYIFPADNVVFSVEIGSSLLVIVENKDNPIYWEKLSDLNQYSIGVVKGYVNTQEFDGMIASGLQRVETVTSDDQNIRKVVSGRVNGAVIDLHVLKYLLAREGMEPLKERIQVNPRSLVEKQLFIAFRNTPEGRRWRDIVNEGLAKIDVDALMEASMPMTNSH
ncbi:transporter substrate-binding domain-containing protein [uncultured Shewanella sp.]|uniref:substrate-binding periplasmic protein n=1 Tax=uncultured Shewanella sp. TaxID=173975 RepID=UPI002614AD49|nr:transporter substrate-binding domain-containing protein [uncultured Shewanella sp.]